MLLKLSNINKSFGSADARNYKQVLNDISLELEKAKTLAILGPSGSGKSTLLNIIGALDLPDSGSIVFNDFSLQNQSEKQLASFRNKEIGFIFQSHHLLPQCNVLENVMIPTLPIKDKTYKNECRQRALELIKKVDLWDQRNDYPGTLSGGECQRVAVIRALINQPKLLLADEPTGSLDQSNANSIIDLLLKLKEAYQTSLIVVTHSDTIGSRMDKKYSLTNGQLSLIGE